MKLAKRDRTEWVFVVDTEQYAGNFERDMGAYLTGMVGEYFPTSASELAEAYKQETGDDGDESQFAGIKGAHEGDGEHEPDYVDIWPTPGWWSDGSGNAHPDAEFDKYQAKRKNPITRYPANLSVAIYFTDHPTPEQLKVLHNRAMLFQAVARTKLKKKVTVTHTLLVKKKTVYEVAQATPVES